MLVDEDSWVDLRDIFDITFLKILPIFVGHVAPEIHILDANLFATG
jgi:hypothetical protein